MAGILADGKTRIGMLCFCVFLYCSLPSYGALPQQPPDQSPTTSDRKVSTPVSPSIKPPSVKPPAKDEKKKAPKEGVKDVHIGPPPPNSPPIKIRVKPLPSTSYKNPVDVSTGQELIPVGK